jgi:hypothetical protein
MVFPALEVDWLCFAQSVPPAPVWRWQIGFVLHIRPHRTALFRTIGPAELGLFVQLAPGPAVRKGRPAAGLCPSRNRRIGFVSRSGLSRRAVRQIPQLAQVWLCFA